MPFKIVITPEAQEDLDYAYQWYAQRTIHAAEWHGSVVDAIFSLSENPERCPLAPEAEPGMRGLHHLIKGRRQHAFRILFVVVDREVFVIRIVHGARSRF